MNKSFRVYNDSSILIRALEFPVILVLILRTFWTSIRCWKDITPSIANVTRLYMIDDVMKIKLATEWRHANLCSDHSTNKSLKLTIGYIGDQC